MSVDFPDNPQIGDIFTSGTIQWIWTGTVWDLYQEEVNLQKRPVDKEYLTTQSMINDQENQVMNYFYYDGEKYWVYLGTTNGDITDYRVLDPTVPEYVKEITEQDINNWNNKLDRIFIEEANLLSGNTYTVFSVDKNEYDSISIDYNVKNTITKAKRTGIIITTWDAETEDITQEEFFSDDLNSSTEDIQILFNIVGDFVNLDVLTNSDEWNVKILVRLL
jgi:hypothetical protein